MTDTGFSGAKPSTLTLVLINLLGWCMLFCFNANIWYVTTLVLITSAGQLFVHVISRGKCMHPVGRIMLFAMPSLLVMVVIGLSVCNASGTKDMYSPTVDTAIHPILLSDTSVEVDPMANVARQRAQATVPVAY